MSAYRETQRNGAQGEAQNQRDYLVEMLWRDALRVMRRSHGYLIRGDWPPGGNWSELTGPLPEWWLESEIVIRGVKAVSVLDWAAAKALARSCRRYSRTQHNPRESDPMIRGRELFYSLVIEDRERTHVQG